MNAVALPKELTSLRGRIMDIDTHEMVPAQEWVHVFGPEVRELADAWMTKEIADGEDKNNPNVPGFAGDILPIDAKIGDIKGPCAPGAMNAARRIEVMDAMGIARQLMFPTNVAMDSFRMLTLPPDDKEFLSAIWSDRHTKARRWIEAYNEWAVDVGKKSDRIRPVFPVVGNSPAELLADAGRHIARGARALWICAGHPPGGVSPAHPEMDHFWALLAETKTTATLHIGTEAGLFASNAWNDAPAFKGYRVLAEFNADPWSLSVVHLPVQNFLATMVSGGVFERHPELRLGVIEVGCWWVGPLMENMDVWHENYRAFSTGLTTNLPMKPSDYIKRNVRVSIFPFENVDLHIERHGLEDVISFCTDYPHVEGGKSALQSLYAKVSRLGPDVVEKFFVKNGEWLLPN